jgi:excisionase family DNA binding protein
VVGPTAAHDTRERGDRTLVRSLVRALGDALDECAARDDANDAAWRDHAEEAARLERELAETREALAAEVHHAVVAEREAGEQADLFRAARADAGLGWRTAAQYRGRALALLRVVRRERVAATVSREGLVEARRLLDAVGRQRDTWRDQTLARAAELVAVQNTLVEERQLRRQVDEEGVLNLEHLVGLVRRLLAAAYALPPETPQDGARFWAAVRDVEAAVGDAEDPDDDGDAADAPDYLAQGFTLTVDEVSRILGIGRATLEDLAESGALPRVLDDGEHFYHPDALNAYLVGFEDDDGDAAGGGE